MKSSIFRALWALAVLALLVVGAAYAAEHPSEHPKAGAEHPAGATVTPDQIAGAVTDFLKADSKLHGGYFLFYDGKKKEPLALSLVRIHKDKITMLKDDLCFVCADFKTPQGKIYDLDFFVSHPEGKKPRASEISIHKEAGTPRYNWVKQGDKWVKQ
jgi:hypothetical protein